MGERCERREAPPEQRGGIMAEQQDTPIDWAGEAKHLYRLADACRSERLSLIEAWDKWAARTAIEASDSGYKAILQGDPPGWDAPDRVVDIWWSLEHSAELLEEAAGLVAAVGTVPMTGVSTHLPSLTAEMEPPLPTWQVMMRLPSGLMPRYSHTRCDT